MDPTTFASKAQTYLRRAVPYAEATVGAAQRIVGGASRHTWSVDVTWDPPQQASLPAGLIFRLDPPASLLESRRGVEYAVYQAVSTSAGAVPVPRPLLIEDGEEALGMPFFVMERLGGVAWPGALLEPAFDANREQIVRQMYTILGALALIEPTQLALEGVLAEPPPADIWALELERWERTLVDHDMGPMPVTRALIAALRRRPPPPAPAVRLVHGDYRIGNLLFSPGGIVGVLDWEMAHLGDPHEDLAWSMARNWRSQKAPERIAAALSPQEAVAEWQSASGFVVDPDALRWWSLFTHLKAVGIWVTGGHAFASGRSEDLMLGYLAWLSWGAQERWMVEDLGVLE